MVAEFRKGKERNRKKKIQDIISQNTGNQKDFNKGALTCTTRDNSVKLVRKV